MEKMEENICLKEASDWPNGRSNTHKKKDREREKEISSYSGSTG